MDQSKKIRQALRIFSRTRTTLLILAVMIFTAIIGLSVPGQAARRVAIFDYDQRVSFPDELARFIEEKLKKMDPTLDVIHYSARGDETKAVEILRDIETKGFDLAIVRTSDALIIAQHTLFKTPTLYTNANNPLWLGFRTLGPPGGNISGASYYIPVEKRLRAYKTMMPALKNPGFIFDKNNKSRKVEIPEAREACAALGLPFNVEFINDVEELPQAAGRLINQGADAIIAASSGTIYENLHRFILDTDRAGIPVFSFYKTGVSEGAVAALSSDFFSMAEELLVPMAQKVLQEKVTPGNLPAAFLKKNKLFVNQPQLTRFGLIIPPALEQENDVIYIQ